MGQVCWIWNILKILLLPNIFLKYEGGPISTLPTNEKRKFWRGGDLFLNIVSFKVDTLDPAMLQLF